MEESKDGSLFSATFATLEGHVEKGVIKFTLTDKGKDNYIFCIASLSEVDQLAAKAFEGKARSEQKASWQEVLDKVVKTSGGTETKRTEKVIKPKTTTSTKKEKK